MAARKRSRAPSPTPPAGADGAAAERRPPLRRGSRRGGAAGAGRGGRRPAAAAPASRPRRLARDGTPPWPGAAAVEQLGQRHQLAQVHQAHQRHLELEARVVRLLHVELGAGEGVEGAQQVLARVAAPPIAVQPRPLGLAGHVGVLEPRRIHRHQQQVARRPGQLAAQDAQVVAALDGALRPARRPRRRPRRPPRRARRTPGRGRPARAPR